MKKIDAVICGIASIFTCSNTISTESFQRFPSSYEKNAEKSVQRAWVTVGRTIKGAIDKYDEESKKGFFVKLD
ncbi:hypothetical protein EGX98_01380 [Fusobacterium necrophorum]|uniref:Lipoprotein n=1 Tax=Fusobacterium necrophorum BL TaxID=1441732 RepID=A0AB73BUV0_9FUSO|nr:hypothetical protein [Fusobacterium necrophorum]AYZ72829.1 hypothetical protein EGX98_01380 [Fusobacterium necrophorum]AZW09173.1 hypothetical protein EO219_06005 [Fusobacterium necrophorum subsp. necrophorum]KDE61338.1 hypothetical protein FUSO5_12010 [Fusobacterium necrophorum BFTR-1]KDE62135.1 hypothetical protein FUSO3_09240 [Fusobacterium necrophorum BL]MDK4522831.1 hypothetical protein [Fusobacterium necrophorum]